MENELSNKEIIEIARKREGLFQKDIAKAIGVSLPTFSRMMARGTFDDVLFIHAKTLEKLLKIKFSMIETKEGKTVKIDI